MGVSYDGVGSELIEDSEQSIWKAGKRCPDIQLVAIGTDEVIRLYSITSYGKYLVLFVGKSGVLQSFKDICTYLILRAGDSAPTPVNGHSNGSQDEVRIFSSDVVTAQDNFTVVVRPDMYIGYVGKGDGWKQYLGQLYVP